MRAAVMFFGEEKAFSNHDDRFKTAIVHRALFAGSLERR